MSGSANNESFVSSSRLPRYEFGAEDCEYTDEEFKKVVAELGVNGDDLKRLQVATNRVPLYVKMVAKNFVKPECKDWKKAIAEMEKEMTQAFTESHGRFRDSFDTKPLSRESFIHDALKMVNKTPSGSEYYLDSCCDKQLMVCRKDKEKNVYYIQAIIPIAEDVIRASWKELREARTKR